MPRLTIKVIIPASVVMLAVGCSAQEGIWTDLEGSDLRSYRLETQRFPDGNSADQPFAIRSVSRSNEQVKKHVFSAEQCHNVQILQEDEAVYVFFEELSLTRFSGYHLDSDLPELVLCDLNLEYCQNLYAQKDALGYSFTQVCSIS